VVEVADSIDEEVNRINHVVTGVLDFARPIPFSLQSADLVQICREAAQAVTQSAEDVPVAFEASEHEAPVVTDSERLRGVLVNVLTNAQHAVRARDADGHAAPPVQVRTKRAAGPRWQVEVRDCGIGIAPADLPRVFEPFFSTRRTGSGLGLALARNVIEGLGGSIAVESQIDTGTIVRIEIPETSQQSPRPL
jgi:signal transduction histidine kinase